MVVGYNHNIKYKGEIFHVQTEDSGINTPHIITLLYRGGNIIASKKTSYADIVKMDNLPQIVEELMKEQHKDMLRRLKNGEFDLRLGLGESGEAEAAVMKDTPSGSAAVAEPAATQVPTPPPPTPLPSPLPVAEVVAAPAKQPAPTEELPTAKQQSLDDIIFEFLSSGDEDR